MSIFTLAVEGTSLLLAYAGGMWALNDTLTGKSLALPLSDESDLLGTYAFDERENLYTCLVELDESDLPPDADLTPLYDLEDTLHADLETFEDGPSCDSDEIEALSYAHYLLSGVA